MAESSTDNDTAQSKQDSFSLDCERCGGRTSLSGGFNDLHRASLLDMSAATPIFERHMILVDGQPPRPFFRVHHQAKCTIDCCKCRRTKQLRDATPLHIAALVNHPEHISALAGVSTLTAMCTRVTRESGPSEVHLVTPLHVAAMEHNVEALHALLKHPVAVMFRDSLGNIPSDYIDDKQLERRVDKAKKRKSEKAFKSLLANDTGLLHGACDTSGQTLLTAIDNNQLEAVERLLAAGLDVNTPFPNSGSPKRTPLECAVTNGHVPLVRLLLAYGAEPQTVAGILEKVQDIHMLEVLLSNGCRPENNSCLLEALSNDRLPIVALLAKYGARLEVSTFVKSINSMAWSCARFVLAHLTRGMAPPPGHCDRLLHAVGLTSMPAQTSASSVFDAQARLSPEMPNVQKIGVQDLLDHLERTYVRQCAQHSSAIMTTLAELLFAALPISYARSIESFCLKTIGARTFRFVAFTGFLRVMVPGLYRHDSFYAGTSAPATATGPRPAPRLTQLCRRLLVHAYAQEWMFDQDLSAKGHTLSSHLARRCSEQDRIIASIVAGDSLLVPARARAFRSRFAELGNRFDNWKIGDLMRKSTGLCVHYNVASECPYGSCADRALDL